MSNSPLPEDLQHFRGHEGVREFWRRWLHLWRSYKVKAEQFVDAGDHVIVDVRFRALGRASRTKLENRHSQVWTMKDGKVIRMRFFQDREEARAVAGVGPRGGQMSRPAETSSE
jgi:ketosteroid isomerase-like protein